MKTNCLFKLLLKIKFGFDKISLLLNRSTNFSQPTNQ
jgi:hypothetical protein